MPNRGFGWGRGFRLSLHVLTGFWSQIMTDFCDTWTFLDRQVKEVFDLEKTIQEVISGRLAPILFLFTSHLFSLCNGEIFAGEIFGRSCWSRNGELIAGFHEESFSVINIKEQIGYGYFRNDCSSSSQGAALF